MKTLPLFAAIAAFAVGCRAAPAQMPSATEIPSKFPLGSYAPKLEAPKVKAGALKLFVATNGSDQNTGFRAQNGPKKSDGPFATLEAARDAIRRLKATGKIGRDGVVVEVAGGRYELLKPFELDTRDSGTPNAPIIYRAARGAKVRLSGGKSVQKWFKVTDKAVLDKWTPEAQQNVRMAPLALAGVSDFGQIVRRNVSHDFNKIAGLELSFDDNVMTLARWPNEGYEKITSTPEGESGLVVGFSADRAARWKDEKDLWAHGYWSLDYFDVYDKVASVDAEKKTITLAPPRAINGVRTGQRFRIVNALSELDSPGEWYLDRGLGMLYFWPPRSLDENPDGAVVSISPRIATFNGTAWVAMENFILENVRGAGVRVDNGVSNTFSGLTSRCIGTNAYEIFGGKNNLVCDGEITQTGEGGVFMTGGNRPTLSPAGHTIENMHVHDWSYWLRCYRSAVRMEGVGMRISHCKIHGAPHNAIAVGGNDMITEYNEIYDVAKETGDVGVYYTGRDWSAPGQIIRFNYFHDVNAPGQAGSSGVYLDDQYSGAHIYGNFFKDMTLGVFVGGGRYHTIENNLFVNCKPSVGVDSRGITWAAGGQSGMKNNLLKMPYQSELWRQRYPFLTNILDDDPQLPKHNAFRHNVSVGSKDWAQFEGTAAPLIEQTDNFVQGFQFQGTDPGFVDAAKGDFRLKSDSGAWKLGWKALPFEEMGLKPGHWGQR